MADAETDKRSKDDGKDQTNVEADSSKLLFEDEDEREVELGLLQHPQILASNKKALLNLKLRKIFTKFIQMINCRKKESQKMLTY